MSDDFYRAFEDRHRGSRELIKSRLRIYLPFVEPLKALYEDCVAVDLGCGRGEWLELMGEVGIIAKGVDLDEGMLAACHERGLAAEKGEAISYLRSLPAQSAAVVSAFHVIEHIPFDALQTLVQEALRALVPAGLLILETPNPENLVVGTSNFYLDPSHRRPLPPLLLSFLPDHYGFARSKIIRLHEPENLAQDNTINLIDVIGGASPDYALLAQKKCGSANYERLFDSAFEKQVGLEIGMLAARYDAGISARLEQLSQTQQQLSHTQQQLSHTQQQLSHTQQQLSHTQQQLSHAQQQLAAAYASSSWRMTAPMRWVATRLRALRGLTARAVLRLKIGLKPRLMRVVSSPTPKRIIEQTGHWVLAHPRLAEPLRMFLRRHNRLRNRLRQVVLGVPSPGRTDGNGGMVMADSAPLNNLTLRARRIYRDLLDALAAKRGAS